MANKFEDEMDSLLNAPLPDAGSEHFMRRMNQRIRQAQRARTIRAITLVAALVIVMAAAFFTALPFLRMAGSDFVHDNPVAAAALWFPYGVVAACLALFLQALLAAALGYFSR
jgi:hypothetical protein